MPRGNGTGPTGYGPMTGRSLGYCAGYDTPGFINAGPGMGMRWGGRQSYGRGYSRGMGRGYAWRDAGAYPVPPAYGAAPYPQYSREDEVQDLKSHADYLKERLNEVEQRLQDMENEQSKE